MKKICRFLEGAGELGGVIDYLGNGRINKMKN